MRAALKILVHVCVSARAPAGKAYHGVRSLNFKDYLSKLLTTTAVSGLFNALQIYFVKLPLRTFDTSNSHISDKMLF